MASLGTLRALQLVTIVLLLGAIGALGYDIHLRRTAPPPRAPEPATPDPKVATDIEALRRKVEALEARKPEAAPAPAPAHGPGLDVRAEAYERRLLCRIRSDAGGLSWRVATNLPAWPFPEGDESGGDGWTRLAAGPRVEVPLPLDGLQPGILHAAAIVRASKETSEPERVPKRLWLGCETPGAGDQLAEIAGPFFPLRNVSPDEAGLKTAATSAAFVVAPGSRLRLVVDADAISRKFVGTLDIYVRCGPLLVITKANQ